jgi:hypothetical protein
MENLNNKLNLHKYDNIDINLERKESIKNLLDENTWTNLMTLAITVGFFSVIFTICFLAIILPEKIIEKIAIFLGILFLGTLFLAIIIIGYSYIVGLLKSRYLPVSDDEAKKININNVEDYFIFINKFMDNKIQLKLFLNKKHIDYIAELARVNNAETVIFRMSSLHKHRFGIEYSSNKKIAYIYLNCNMIFPTINIDYADCPKDILFI